jgi:hypothetical protein
MGMASSDNLIQLEDNSLPGIYADFHIHPNLPNTNNTPSMPKYQLNIALISTAPSPNTSLLVTLAVCFNPFA